MSSLPIPPTPELTESICAFLQNIGFTIQRQPIDEETFLPGVLIKNGTLILDEEKLKYPGDLLHEAGHIAVMKPEERESSYGNVGSPADAQKALGEEIMAICWSYAALHKLGLPPQVVFHPDGYKGSSEWLIEQYSSGSYVGVATLQWIGLCHDPKTAQEKKTEPYPHMLKWFRSN